MCMNIQQNDNNDANSLSILKVLDTIGFDQAMWNFSAYQDEFRYHSQSLDLYPKWQHFEEDLWDLFIRYILTMKN